MVTTPVIDTIVSTGSWALEITVIVRTEFRCNAREADEHEIGSSSSSMGKDCSVWNLGCRFLKTSLVKVLQGHDSPTRRFRRDNAFVLGSGPD